MRLNTKISSTGICSRRQADQLIKEGKVTINGEVAQIGQQVNESDEIRVNGELIKRQSSFVYIAFNKPKGITCTTEKHIKGNIIDYIHHKERIFPIGRLDKDSEGLILLTNDGSIVNKILESKNENKKEYLVMVNKPITKEFLNKMSSGVEIYNPVRNEYVITNQCEVSKINNREFKIILTQGYNRQIRRMCTKCGYQVKELKRIKVMNIELADLKVGQWRNLTELELLNLFKQLEVWMTK